MKNIKSYYRTLTAISDTSIIQRDLPTLDHFISKLAFIDIVFITVLHISITQQ